MLSHKYGVNDRFFDTMLFNDKYMKKFGMFVL